MRTFKPSHLTLQLAVIGAIGASAATSEALPNPASTHCAAVGGQVEILTGQTGEIGFCQLGRALIEEWTLLRGAGEAVSTFLAHPYVAMNGGSGTGLPDPSAVYCVAQGGAVETLRQADGDELGACRFEDGTMIDSWTLLRGPSDPVNQALTRLLLAAQPPAAGALRPVSSDDPGVVAAAQFAVEQLDARCNCLEPFTLEGIFDARTQVVAGLAYHLTLRLARGSRIETHAVVVISPAGSHSMVLESDKILGT